MIRVRSEVDQDLGVADQSGAWQMIDVCQPDGWTFFDIGPFETEFDAMRRIDMAHFWKTIVDTMMDGLMVVDTDGMIVAVNRALEQLTGRSRDELIGSPCTILNCDNCSASCAPGDGFSCDVFAGTRIERRKCTLTRKDGKTVPVMKNASVLTGNDGRVTGCVETITDLSEIVERDRRIRDLSSFLKRKDHFHGIIGKSRVMEAVFDLISDAAQSDAPVIIYGESGTGKELVAEALHKMGKRRHGPFVKVNCAALSETLLESELFGHVKGAFTGADRTRKGRFELAHKGDIFLDEIGDIPTAMQVKILRALQEKEIERVGEGSPIKLDVRIISATHRNLDRMIQEEKFREDLFYRLNVIPIRLPPLRERLDDLPLLVEYFIEQNRLKTGKPISGVSAETMAVMNAYSWPGNVRELVNAIDYAFVVCRQDTIEPGRLPEAIVKAVEGGRRFCDACSATRGNNDLIDALRKTGGVKTEAAKLLGISRQALWKRMKKLGVKADYRVDGGDRP
jgi:PAS domain S-box-containing protein